MEVKLYKEDMKKRVLYPFISDISYEHFITKLMKLEIKERGKNHFIVEVPEEFLVEETYKNKTWYRSRDKKFGIFLKGEDWKMVFQR